jgi:hypothetical protein
VGTKGGRGGRGEGGGGTGAGGRRKVRASIVVAQQAADFAKEEQDLEED